MIIVFPLIKLFLMVFLTWAVWTRGARLYPASDRSMCVVHWPSLALWAQEDASASCL